MDCLEKQVDENLKLVGKKKENFLKQARALRYNLKLRKEQQRQKKCMHSK